MSNRDTKKFIVALAIYVIAIIFTDIMITDKTIAPAHLQNDKEQGRTYHAGDLRMLDRSIQPGELNEQIEPSRGETLISSRSQEGQELTLQATAYCPTGRRTYTETWPKEGRTIATDISLIPPGSKVFIEGLGWRVAEDRIPESSIRKGAKIDVFMDSEADAWEWGRRNVKVVIIPPREDLKNN